MAFTRAQTVDSSSGAGSVALAVRCIGAGSQGLPQVPRRWSAASQRGAAWRQRLVLTWSGSWLAGAWCGWLAYLREQPASEVQPAATVVVQRRRSPACRGVIGGASDAARPEVPRYGYPRLERIARPRTLRRSQRPGCDIIDLLGGAFAHRWTLRAVDRARCGAAMLAAIRVQSGDGVHGRRPACTQRGVHTRTRTRATARRGLLKGRGKRRHRCRHSGGGRTGRPR